MKEPNRSFVQILVGVNKKNIHSGNVLKKGGRDDSDKAAARNRARCKDF